jgi:uncharacterized metal-binding protein YceD (DUF177 family)
VANALPPNSDRPEFSRVIELATLHDRLDFDITPEAAEAASLARLMGATAVRKLRFRGSLTPLAPRGWALDATLGATVVQPCVVTLEPVTTRIDADVHRRFLPTAGEAVGELVFDPEGEDDEVEPLGERIDLGLIATEALALALPAYPRSPGAELRAADAGEAAGDDVVKPFAALAALRDKLGNSS